MTGVGSEGPSPSTLAVGINAFGFYLGPTSWAKHAQSFFQAMNKRLPVRLFGSGGVPDGSQLSAGESAFLALLRDETALDPTWPSIGIGPIESMVELRGNRRIGFVVWETTRLPPDKIEILRLLEEVWTPSTWGRACLIANGLDPERVFVVPEGVDVGHFRPPEISRANSPVFRFLCVGKWEERKATRQLLRAFAAEFDPAEPVELVLHAANPYRAGFDIGRNVRRVLWREHLRGKRPRIVPSEPLSGEDLPRLYQSCDAFVLPTRAEGWGLPILEAMASGLPVIATCYSAPADYLNDRVAYPLAVRRLVRVRDRHHFAHAAELGSWAEPDFEQLRRLMRHVYEHRQEAAARGRAAREEVCSRWTWDHAATKACAVLSRPGWPLPFKPIRNGEPTGEQRRRQIEHVLAKSTHGSPHRFQGRGVLLCGGGETFFVCAWIALGMLRRHGCALPVEFWYRGPREMNATMIALLGTLGVRCVDAYEHSRTHPVRRLDAWELKAYALLHCSFAEVLYLDADNVPLRNPEALFDNPLYRIHGALFWPDRYAGPGTGKEWLKREAWALSSVPYRLEPEIEAGQMLLDKRRCWQALALTLHLNEHSDFYYAYFYGDKDTFHLAWRRTGLNYGLMPHAPRTLGKWEGILQFDAVGAPLFAHRSGAKWTRRSDRRVAGFPQEGLCRSFLAQLRERWTESAPAFPADFSPAELVWYRELCDARWFEYSVEKRRRTHRRRLELLPDLSIGRGAREMEVSWMLEADHEGRPLLSLRNANAPTCFLRRSPDGVWRGRWLVYDRGRVELRAQVENH